MVAKPFEGKLHFTFLLNSFTHIVSTVQFGIGNARHTGTVTYHIEILLYFFCITGHGDTCGFIRITSFQFI